MRRPSWPRASAEAIRQAVARLPHTMSVRDVGELLGISHQRVGQIRAELVRRTETREASVGG
jgi:transposase-like protein